MGLPFYETVFSTKCCRSCYELVNPAPQKKPTIHSKTNFNIVPFNYNSAANKEGLQFFFHKTYLVTPH